MIKITQSIPTFSKFYFTSFLTITTKIDFYLDKSKKRDDAFVYQNHQQIVMTTVQHHIYTKNEQKIIIVKTLTISNSKQ
jgi:hypothetical protein